MTYADVALDRPVDQLFTYALKPEHLPTIQEGSLVEVPLGPRREYGIVWKLRRREPSGMTGKLRALSRVLSPGVWAPNQTRRLGRRLADETGQALGVCLFRLLPPAGKQHLFELPDSASTSGRTFHVLGPHAHRLTQYRALIERASLAQRSTILIAAQVVHDEIVRSLGATTPTFVVTGQLSAGKQREQLGQFLATPGAVLLGTRHVVGWPATRLGLLIVDDVIHQSHVDDQRPYADAALIATLRHRVEGGHLVLGSGVPSLQMARRELESRAALLPQVDWQRRLTFSSIRSIADLFDQVSEPPNRLVVIAPRQGQGGTIGCHDCHHILRCQTCGGELNALDRILQCYDCGQVQPMPTSCPACSGHQLRIGGIGVEAIRTELRDHKTQIGTEQLLDMLTPVATIVFAYADSPLLSPDPTRALRYLCRIVEATGLADRVIVQTHHPEHVLWRYLLARTASDRELFLAERRERQLSPYATA